MAIGTGKRKKRVGHKGDYRYIDKDPLIDVIRTEADRDGFLARGNLKKLATDSGVGEGTIRNWFFGDTKRPHGFNMRMVLEAMGVKTRYVRADGTELRGPKRIET